MQVFTILAQTIKSDHKAVMPSGKVTSGKGHKSKVGKAVRPSRKAACKAVIQLEDKWRLQRKAMQKAKEKGHKALLQTLSLHHSMTLCSIGHQLGCAYHSSGDFTFSLPSTYFRLPQIQTTLTTTMFLVAVLTDAGLA